MITQWLARLFEPIVARLVAAKLHEHLDNIDLNEHVRYTCFADGVNGHLERVKGLIQYVSDKHDKELAQLSLRIDLLEMVEEECAKG